MGRWFGYRDGYGDLCRLWLTAEAEGWYRHVTDATAELKRDFARMRRRQATPREFGLRVRTHPDTLLITARNKMASGLDVVGETRDISLIGRMVESSRLYADERRNRQNLDIVDRFIEGLVASQGLPEPSPHSGAVLWREVPAESIASLVDAFLVHPMNHDFQGDSIADFLRELPSRGDMSLARWTVALPVRGAAGEVKLSSLPDVMIHAKERRVDVTKATGSLLVSGKGARVGSSPDVRHGMSKESARQVEEDWRQSQQGAISGDAYRAVMQAPLLVTYLLRGIERQSGGGAKILYHQDLVLPALALHFPGAPDPDAPRRLVRYRLNAVAQTELFPVDIDEEDNSNDADPDD